jgi:polar amino acid transport system substrate-binding protein
MFPLLLSLSALAIQALAGPAAAVPAPPSALEEVRRRGELTWAGDLQGGEPFVSHDRRNPALLVGFEVEIARGLARRLGVRDRFVQNDWHNLLPSLERGDFDIVLNGLEDSAAVRARALVSRPYLEFTEALVVRKASRSRSLAMLRGQRVGTLGGSLAHQLLRAEPAIQIVLYEGQEEPYADLRHGRIAAVLLDGIIAARYGLVHPELELADGDVARGRYVIAVRRGREALRDALDGALDAMERDGELPAILDRWNVWPPAPGAASLPGAASGSASTTGSASGSGAASASASGPESEPGSFDAAQLLLLLRGAVVTLLVSVLAMLLAAPLGLVLALARLYGSRPLRLVADAYVELFRGTPVLLQLYVLYYGLAPIVHLNALSAAVLGLGLNYGAYEAEVHRAALSAVPVGQSEAAAALGLSRLQTLRLVLLPQSLRWALPAMTNDLIALLKDSSLVSVITVVELTKQMTITAVDVRSWGLPGLACALLYLGLSWPLGRLARLLEAHLDRERGATEPQGESEGEKVAP